MLNQHGIDLAWNGSDAYFDRTGYTMHTPRITFLFALQQGVGFVPVPGLGEGIASMQRIFASSGVPGRASAALLLGADRDSATIDALRDALSDKDSSVRAAAANSISLRNDPALKKELEPLLHDSRARAGACSRGLPEIVRD